MTGELITKGIIAIYKPKGPTSHDIINKLRKITGVRRIGHAGTLDPNASGVLVVGIGREATKKLVSVVSKEKEYVATIQLGEESTTDDAEGDKTVVNVQHEPAKEEVMETMNLLKGDAFQVPPAYSAVKVGGQKAYKVARKGKTLKLKPRRVEIKSIEILEYQWPLLKIRVVTGPGVYIRSLARDIGRLLETGGYVLELERTRVGEFTKERAIRLDM